MSAAHLSLSPTVSAAAARNKATTAENKQSWNLIFGVFQFDCFFRQRRRIFTLLYLKTKTNKKNYMCKNRHKHIFYHFLGGTNVFLSLIQIQNTDCGNKHRTTHT